MEQRLERLLEKQQDSAKKASAGLFGLFGFGKGSSTSELKISSSPVSKTAAAAAVSSRGSTSSSDARPAGSTSTSTNARAASASTSTSTSSRDPDSNSGISDLWEMVVDKVSTVDARLINQEAALERHALTVQKLRQKVCNKMISGLLLSLLYVA
jgi:hypothetical protein